MLVLMWTGMLVLLYQQYKHESAIRTEQISKELKFINSRIINAYKNDIDMRPFMNFINDYFANSMYEGISVCVYDKEGRLIYNAGDTPIIQDFSEAAERAEFREAEATGEGSNEYQEDDQFFYSAALKSNDGKIYVQTTVPYTMTIGEAIRANTNFWIIFVIFVAMGGICYFSTRYLTKTSDYCATSPPKPPTTSRPSTKPTSPTTNSATYHERSSSSTATKPTLSRKANASTRSPFMQ